MRLSVIGSGDAFGGCGCNAGYLVDGTVLVDCGAPAHVLIQRVGESVQGLRLVLITHFHADHTFMLPVLLGAYALTPAPGPPGLIIAGPVGTKEYVCRLLATGYGSHLQGMIDEHARLQFCILQDGSDTVLAGHRVRAHAVVHSTGPSLAYVLTDEAGTSIGFSGDSAMCAGLQRAVSQADCMVCECTGWDGPTPGGHLWSAEVAQLLTDNPTTQFVVSHLSERRRLQGAIVAHDLLTLDITPR